MKIHVLVLACMIFCITLSGGHIIIDAEFPVENDADTGTSSGEAAAGDLFDVASWLCVYDGVDAADIVAAAVDLVNVDPDGFSRGDVAAMQDSGKIVVAYLSIGEAEEYRYYWDPDASYLLEENPDWAGNWYVDFSSREWQSLIIDDYIPRIRAKGFDGLYLDTLETYHLEDRYPACSQEHMTAFVENISTAYRSPSFYLIAQNGLEIAADIAPSVDGVGVEETYCRAVYVTILGQHVNGIPQRPVVTGAHEETMDWLRDQGKLVLTLDYAVLRFQVTRCYQRSREQGYVPYVSTAVLDSIRLPPAVYIG